MKLTIRLQQTIVTGQRSKEQATTLSLLVQI